MRFVIVGGGAIALLTAVNCVSAGHAVTVVDQADIPFSGATSFDRHRVTRALILNEPAAAVAAVDAHYRWIALQDMLSTRIYEQVGALTVLPQDKVAQAQPDPGRRRFTDACPESETAGPEISAC